MFNEDSSLHIPLANMSALYAADELNEYGVPFGFFHQPVKGFPDGYPLFIPVQASAAHAEARFVVRSGVCCLSEDDLPSPF